MARNGGALLGALMALAPTVGQPASNLPRVVHFPERVNTSASCVIVQSLRKWAPSQHARVRFTAATAPPRCDVAILMDGSGWNELPRSVASSRLQDLVRTAGSVFVVVFDSSESPKILEAEGYPLRSLLAFSPYHSGFSKTAFLTWAARQAYSMFWFTEEDALLPCGWSRFIKSVSPWALARRVDHQEKARMPFSALEVHAKAANAWVPTPPLGANETLVSPSCSIHHADAGWPWAQPDRCNYCDGGRHSAVTSCFLAVFGATKGVLRRADGLLRRGLHAHHELHLAAACQSMCPRRLAAPKTGTGTAAAGSCSCTIYSLERTDLVDASVFSSPQYLRHRAFSQGGRKTFTRVKTMLEKARRTLRTGDAKGRSALSHAFQCATRWGGNRARLRNLFTAGTSREANVLLHPVKTEGNVLTGLQEDREGTRKANAFINVTGEHARESPE